MGRGRVRCIGGGRSRGRYRVDPDRSVEEGAEVALGIGKSSRAEEGAGVEIGVVAEAGLEAGAELIQM